MHNKTFAALRLFSMNENGTDLLWAKSQQLPEDVFRHLQTIYGDHFPIEARHHLAGKIWKF